MTLENFDRTQPQLDDQSFAFDLDANGLGRITCLVANIDVLVHFTGGEGILNGGAQGSPISASAVSFQVNSHYGTKNGVPAKISADGILYVQRQGLNIRQLLYSDLNKKYLSQDISQLASHLAQSGVVQMAVQRQFEGQGIVWAVTTNGRLIGMTYDMDQQVYGWHKHTTGEDTGDIFESVAVIEGQGFNDDEVWVVVNRTVNGAPNVRSVERINPLNWLNIVPSGKVQGGINPFYGYFVDGGVQYTYPNANVSTNSVTHASIISGLSGLVGRTVDFWVNCQKVGSFVVNGSGQIAITPDQYYPFQVNDVLNIGLPIPYIVQPMRLDVDLKAGITQGITKAIARGWLRLYNSLGGQISNGTRVMDIIYRKPTDPLGAAPPIFSGEYPYDFFGDYLTDPTIIIQGSDALPFTLLAIITEYDLTPGT